MLKFLRGRRAQGATEYIMILALLVAVVLIAGKFMKKNMPDVVNRVFSRITGGISSASNTNSNTP